MKPRVHWGVLKLLGFVGLLGTALQAQPAAPADPRLQLPGAALAAVDETGPLDLSVEAAVLSALSYNRALLVEQFAPPIAGTFAALERAAFDPVLFAEYNFAESEARQLSTAVGVDFQVRSDQRDVAVGVRQQISTGTEVELAASQQRSDSDRTPEQSQVRLGLSVTQALLQGASRRANLVSLRQAELDVDISHYQLRGFVAQLVADVEHSYWNYVLARRQLDIFLSSLEIADRQLAETRQRIAVGALPETEQLAVEAEAAARRQELIDARATLARERVRLLRLINMDAHGGRSREILPIVGPLDALVPLEPVEAHIELARRLRAEINEARLRWRRGDLDVIRTRNGLLPVLDFFIVLGKSGFASSFSDAADDLDGDSFDLQAGLRFEYPFGNRGPEASHRGAVLAREQVAAGLENLAELMAVEVHEAYVEVQRAGAQIGASRATLRLRESVLAGEQAKLAAGRATGLDVARAQRDLLEAQIANAQARIAYRQALIELYRLDGSLLQRRAIGAPGAEPVVLSLAD
ncbi:MAG: TolC family protein [Pseudomonadota bacterium]|nr:TolC family protein [Pseudomonadota bacterium]